MHYVTIINLDFHMRNTIKHSLDLGQSKLLLEHFRKSLQGRLGRVKLFTDIWVSVSEPHTSAFNVEFCLYGTYVCTSQPARPAQLYTV